MKISTSHHQTAPEDRIPVSQKIIYGSGMMSNNILALSIVNLVPFIYTAELGVSAVLIGWVLAIRSLWDAFTDPIVGYITDNHKSRWGRRKPFILGGGIAVSILLVLMWQIPRGLSETQYTIFFLVSTLLFYLAYTIFITPYNAVGFELTSDYHERTRLMGTVNWIATIGNILMGWAFYITKRDFFEDSIQGVSIFSIFMGVFVFIFILLPVIFVKEPTKHLHTRRQARTDSLGKGLAKEMTGFFNGLMTTLKNRNFRYLCYAMISFFPGLLLVQQFGHLLVLYFLYNGDNEAGSGLMSWINTTTSVTTLLAVPLVTYVSTRVGKRTTFIVCAGLAIFGSLIKWYCYQPSMPYLKLIPEPLMGLGWAALWVLFQSMLADICDEDELNTGKRREATYGSVFWWIVKLGMALSALLSGYLLNFTGFDEDLPAVEQAPSVYFWMRVCDVALPVVFISLAIWFVYKFGISENRSYEIKEELEARRGKVKATAEPV